MWRAHTLIRHPVTWLVLTAGTAVAAVALALFQPWKLWVDQSVHEAPPSAARPAAASGSMVLAGGTFISHEHATTGTARIVRTADGARYLRLEDLDTSNGPLLKVWLSDTPLISGTRRVAGVRPQPAHRPRPTQRQQGQPELSAARRRGPQRVPQRQHLVRPVPRLLRRRRIGYPTRNDAVVLLPEAPAVARLVTGPVRVGTASCSEPLFGLVKAPFRVTSASAGRA